MRNAPPDQNTGSSILVPVGTSVTLRNTVAYAIQTARYDDVSSIHFVAPVAWRDIGDASDAERAETDALLERVTVWAREDAGDEAITVETATIGADEYLFSPEDYAETLARYAAEHGIERVIVDPEYSPGGNVPLLQPMENELERRGLDVEEAPVETPVRRTRLLGSGSLAGFATLFVISFAFYQLLGGFAIVTGDRFDLFYELITGAITAGIVAGTLHRVTMSARPNVRRLAGQIGRLCLYVPYLVFEIVKSNILITFIILHPKLPINPRMTRVRSAVWGGSALTTLGNSITLTPGTLTVRVDGNDLYVHALFDDAREGLFDGSLERWVRFVFYGRSAAAIATPDERGDAELLDGDASETEEVTE